MCPRAPHAARARVRWTRIVLVLLVFAVRACRLGKKCGPKRTRANANQLNAKQRPYDHDNLHHFAHTRNPYAHTHTTLVQMCLQTLPKEDPSRRELLGACCFVLGCFNVECTKTLSKLSCV
jgi:hypothetical protein